MSNAQKNYLKKWAIALGCTLILGLLITCLVLGEPWDWIAFGVVVAALVTCVAVLVIEAIASLIWHWRLMGVCESEWEEEMLAHWWRYMNYWGGCWEDLIPKMIAEYYEPDSVEYILRMRLFEKFKSVKMPRCKGSGA